MFCFITITILQANQAHVFYAIFQQHIEDKYLLAMKTKILIQKTFTLMPAEMQMHQDGR